jgi:CBS domain containing-hemolysin-like protein
MRDSVRSRIHIAQVVNEFGDSVGIVTLEDMLETLLGEEILDESDRHADLQRLARERYQRQVSAPES